MRGRPALGSHDHPILIEDSSDIDDDNPDSDDSTVKSEEHMDEPAVPDIDPAVVYLIYWSQVCSSYLYYPA